MTISHEFFGKITLDSYDLWGKEMTLNGKPVAVYLSTDTETPPTQEILDKCAEICQNIEQFDQQNREFLINFLTEDSEFIDVYLKEQATYVGSETLDKFYQGDKSVTAFVNLLQAMQINLILNDSKTKIATDYMIDQAVSDQILCVYRKLNGNLMDIAWES